jgi:hypothetical protein
VKLRIAAAFVMVSILAFAAPAAAQAADEGSRPMGIRLETQLGWFNLVGVDGNAGGINPQGDIKIGYDIDAGLTPLIGLGYRSASTMTGDDNDTEDSSTALVLAIELRYYLQKHRRGLQPFVFGEFNTSILSESSGGEDDDEAADRNNHSEVNVGFGAEYKFSRAFAVGGKWGLGFGFKGYEVEGGGTDNDESDTTWGTNSSIYLAWRF